MNIAADIALTAMAFLVLVFTLLYGFRSAWKTNRIGKIFLVKSSFLSLVLIQVCVSVWTSSYYPFRDEIRLTIYGLGALSFAVMIKSLWREQQRDRNTLIVVEDEE